MNETDHIDNELFRRIKQGDRAAFTSIYERYNKMLYLLASRYFQNSTMAEDAVQHVFTRLWEFRSDIYVDLNARNYLFTMMKNYVLNTIRNENNAIEKNYQIAYSEQIYDDSLIEKIEEEDRQESGSAGRNGGCQSGGIGSGAADSKGASGKIRNAVCDRNTE